MEEMNIDKEALVSLYKNAHIALQTISDIVNEVSDENMRKELADQYDGYEKYIGKLSSYMKETSTETKDINPLKKAVMFASVKMNTLTDDSSSHVAELMIKGTVMGITELHELLNDCGDSISETVRDYAKELTELEESYEERLKKFL
mgnify:FL=1